MTNYHKQGDYSQFSDISLTKDQKNSNVKLPTHAFHDRQQQSAVRIARIKNLNLKTVKLQKNGRSNIIYNAALRQKWRNPKFKYFHNVTSTTNKKLLCSLQYISSLRTRPSTYIQSYNDCYICARINKLNNDSVKCKRVERTRKFLDQPSHARDNTFKYINARLLAQESICAKELSATLNYYIGNVSENNIDLDRSLINMAADVMNTDIPKGNHKSKKIIMPSEIDPLIVLAQELEFVLLKDPLYLPAVYAISKVTGYKINLAFPILTDDKLEYNIGRSFIRDLKLSILLRFLSTKKTDNLKPISILIDKLRDTINSISKQGTYNSNICIRHRFKLKPLFSFPKLSDSNKQSPQKRAYNNSTDITFAQDVLLTNESKRTLNCKGVKHIVSQLTEPSLLSTNQTYPSSSISYQYSNLSLSLSEESDNEISMDSSVTNYSTPKNSISMRHCSGPEDLHNLSENLFPTSAVTKSKINLSAKLFYEYKDKTEELYNLLFTSDKVTENIVCSSDADLFTAFLILYRSWPESWATLAQKAFSSKSNIFDIRIGNKMLGTYVYTASSPKQALKIPHNQLNFDGLVEDSEDEWPEDVEDKFTKQFKKLTSPNYTKPTPFSDFPFTTVSSSQRLLCKPSNKILGPSRSDSYPNQDIASVISLNNSANRKLQRIRPRCMANSVNHNSYYQKKILTSRVSSPQNRTRSAQSHVTWSQSRVNQGQIKSTKIIPVVESSKSNFNRLIPDGYREEMASRSESGSNVTTLSDSSLGRPTAIQLPSFFGSKYKPTNKQRFIPTDMNHNKKVDQFVYPLESNKNILGVKSANVVNRTRSFSSDRLYSRVYSNNLYNTSVNLKIPEKMVSDYTPRSSALSLIPISNIPKKTEPLLNTSSCYNDEFTIIDESTELATSLSPGENINSNNGLNIFNLSHQKRLPLQNANQLYGMVNMSNNETDNSSSQVILNWNNAIRNIIEKSLTARVKKTSSWTEGFQYGTLGLKLSASELQSVLFGSDQTEKSKAYNLSYIIGQSPAKRCLWHQLLLPLLGIPSSETKRGWNYHAVILVGPAASGKSTLSAACANEVNRPFIALSASQSKITANLSWMKCIAEWMKTISKNPGSIILIDKIDAFLLKYLPIKKNLNSPRNSSSKINLNKPFSYNQFEESECISQSKKNVQFSSTNNDEVEYDPEEQLSYNMVEFNQRESDYFESDEMGRFASSNVILKPQQDSYNEQMLNRSNCSASDKKSIMIKSKHLMLENISYSKEDDTHSKDLSLSNQKLLNLISLNNYVSVEQSEKYKSDKEQFDIDKIAKGSEESYKTESDILLDGYKVSKCISDNIDNSEPYINEINDIQLVNQDSKEDNSEVKDFHDNKAQNDEQELYSDKELSFDYIYQNLMNLANENDTNCGGDILISLIELQLYARIKGVQLLFSADSLSQLPSTVLDIFPTFAFTASPCKSSRRLIIKSICEAAFTSAPFPATKVEYLTIASQGLSYGEIRRSVVKGLLTTSRMISSTDKQDIKVDRLIFTCVKMQLQRSHGAWPSTQTEY